MVETLVENFQILVIGAFVAVVVVGRIERVAGALLGLLACALIAWTGAQVYARGGGIGLRGLFALPEVGFYLFCTLLAALQLVSLRFGLAARAERRRRARARALEDET